MFKRLIPKNSNTTRIANPYSNSPLLLRFLTMQSKPLLSIEQCRELPSARFPEYIKEATGKLYNVIWRSAPPTNIYVVKKPWDTTVREAMIEFINHLHKEYPSVNVIVSEDVADELTHELISTSKIFDPNIKHTIYTGTRKEIVERTDLMVTLGGDGTILRGVSYFSNVSVPPVLSFAMGTLGFLLPFDFKNCFDTFRMVYESRSKALHRNRLECHVIRKDPEAKKENGEMIHAMNDITLHRGSLPNLTSLDIFIDDEFFTTTVADGLVFATPTGSTAYSLSAGGSITHPAVPCILLTPICPRSLSFRPLILPITSDIMIKLSESNRNPSIELTIDGISQHDLRVGDEIHVVSDQHVPTSPDLDKKKSWGIWCITKGPNDWTKDINELLGFNSGFRGQKNKPQHL
ncbi:POS5 [[Candida] subhashii]|uniref:POS5 n=1 Tax=[Candida] subhashii TaxID=561895 RepID=A0A8J5QH91_9ASCO|nr:POS5 [[Candida] subhashii]KAG7665699.1 POS5 [[Candida] subhashii]